MKKMFFFVIFLLVLCGVYAQIQPENNRILGRWYSRGLEIILYDIDIINEFELFRKATNEEIIWEDINVLFTLSFPGGAIPPGVMFFLSNSIMLLNSSNLFSGSGYRENRFFRFSQNTNELELKSVDIRLGSEIELLTDGVYYLEIRSFSSGTPVIDFLGWRFFLD